MTHDRLFRRAEVLVEKQILRAVRSTDGDATHALRALVEWANAGGRERRITLIRATRHLVGCPPTIAAVVDRAIAEVGEDAARSAGAELLDPRENSARRLALEHEVAVAGAIHAWVRQECRSWREERAA
jgi:hypothetical protein